MEKQILRNEQCGLHCESNAINLRHRSIHSFLILNIVIQFSSLSGYRSRTAHHLKDIRTIEYILNLKRCLQNELGTYKRNNYRLLVPSRIAFPERSRSCRFIAKTVVKCSVFNVRRDKIYITALRVGLRKDYLLIL